MNSNPSELNQHLYPVLYKRTSAGKVQTWQMLRDGARYRAISGQEDGKKTESGWTTAEPKNVGKSNATTANEQAHLEVEAQYKKKLAQGGYHESRDGIDTAKFFKPMLAKGYDEGVDIAGASAQPKLDGVRCIANADGLWTRQGKPITAVPHISDDLRAFFEEFPDAVLDGELYNHELRDNFNEIVSLVRKKNPSPEHIARTAEVVQYHIYDYPSHVATFHQRFSKMVLDLANMGSSTSIVFVATAKVQSREELDELYYEWIAQGYEGQMVRLPGIPYEQKRSKSLLKRKDFQDEEFTIISIEEGKGNRSGMAGFINYELGDGRTFGSGISGSHDYCKQLLADAGKYVGGTGTVRFQGLTPDGVPRFPVTVTAYEGKRDV